MRAQLSPNSKGPVIIITGIVAAILFAPVVLRINDAGAPAAKAETRFDLPLEPAADLKHRLNVILAKSAKDGAVTLNHDEVRQLAKLAHESCR